MKRVKTRVEVNDRPATTQEGRENQLIAMAYNLAEERMCNGTATSQEIVHFLKLGTQKSRLEEAKIQEEITMLKAKTDMIESAQRTEAIYREAIEAFKSYSGQGDDEPDEDIF